MAMSETMRHRHRHLVNNPFASDMSLFVVSEQCSIPAHMAIMITAGPVFRKLLIARCERREPNEPIVIPIDSVSKDNVMVMLDYLYTGCLNSISVANAIGVIGLAYQFQLHLLRQHCNTLMYTSVSVHNALPIYRSIFDLSANMRARIGEFIEDNMVRLSRPKPDASDDIGLFGLELRQLDALDWHRPNVCDMFANVVHYARRICRQQCVDYELARSNGDWFVRRLPLGRMSPEELEESVLLAGPQFFGPGELEALREEVAEVAEATEETEETVEVGESLPGAPMMAAWYKNCM